MYVPVGGRPVRAVLICLEISFLCFVAAAAAVRSCFFAVSPTGTPHYTTLYVYKILIRFCGFRHNGHARRACCIMRADGVSEE